MPKSETYYISSEADIPIAINRAVASIVRDIESNGFADILADQIPMLEKKHAEYFRKRRGPAGEPWKPLSPVTVLKKGHNKPLVESGDLQASLTSKASGAIRRISNRMLVFGTSVPYSKFHIHGFRNHRTMRNVPARVHVGLGTETITRLANQVADGIIKRL